ncbi:MAG: Ig-like domain-containing protein, partial [Geovibrio sp.]|nr:Ig-like domain-containing protein [Geovibrio sp.]
MTVQLRKTVTVTITGTNDQPEVRDVSKIVFEDGRVIDGQLEVTDVDTGDTHTFALVDDAPAGFTLNPDGSWSFDPDNDAYDSLAKGDVLVLKIPYTATDSSGAFNAESEEGMITIKVIGTNDRPEVEDVEFGVYENGAKYTGQLDVTDVDEGDKHIFLPASKLPAGFILLPNGEYSFNPSNPAYESLREGQEITLTVKYVAVDDSVSLNSISETGTITITVTGTNDQPWVKNVSKTVYEGGDEISGQVKAYDIDNGDTHTFALVDDAPAGFTFNSDGTWSFDPADPAYDSLAKGEILTLKIPFTATDNSGAANAESEEGFITIKVKGTNDAPVAVNDEVEVDEDGSVTFGVLGNDYDVDGDSISIKDFTQPEHGTVTLNQDGTFTYVPNENYNGDDSFTYTIKDQHGETSTATVSVTVNPVNDAPVAVDDGRPNFSFSGLSGNYYAVSTEFNGLSGSTYNNDNGYLIDNLTEFKHIVDTTDPAATFEATKIWYGYGNNNGVSTGNSLAEFLNHDGASLEYVNGQTNTEEGGFHISGKIWIEAGTYNFKVYADDGYDILIDGESVAKFVNNQSPATHVHDSFTIEESGWYDIDMYWWDQGGEYVFQPSISDDGGLTYTLLTNEGTYVTDEDTAIDFTAADLLDNDFDIDGDELTIIGVGNAVNGEVVLNDDGSVTFTPDADYNGPAQFEYTISDGNGGEDTATVYLVVSPVNDAPVAADDFAETNENESIIINVLDNDTDVDGDSLSIDTYDGTSENGGTVTLNQDGTFSYTPAQGFSGTDTFTYTVTDGNGGFDTATVTVEVADTNDVPVAQNDFVSVVEGSSTTQTVNLVLVLDTSTSMNDKVGSLTRLQIAKAALQNLIDKYGDSLGSVMLVDFND